MTLILLPLRLLVAWLTLSVALSQTNQSLHNNLGNANIKVRTIGLFPKGVAPEEEARIDTDGAQHVEKVFLHRFAHVLGNATERSKLESALDFLSGVEAQLQNVFTAVPPSAQMLLDSVLNDDATKRLAKLAGELSAFATHGGEGLGTPWVKDILTQMGAQIAELSPDSSHPITRRLVLASLVRLQLLIHRPQTAAAQAHAPALRDDAQLPELVFHILRQLFNLHRQGAAAKGAIEFLHVSKSGGTSMCSVADRNGCQAESTTNFGNCMVRRFDDRPRWVSAQVHNLSAPLNGWRWFYRWEVRRGARSCEYRDEFLKRMRYNFFSNEFAVHGGLETGDGSSSSSNSGGSSSGDTDGPTWASAHLCSQFLNVVMLRQPLARLLSHVKWIIKVYRAEYGRRSEAFFRARDADYWRGFAPAAVDNYYIRLLLGEGVFYAPTGTINTTHLEAAKLVLLQYDVVLLLEAGDIDELWLKMALGWRVGLSAAHARVAANHRATNELVPFDVDELMAANVEDTALYDFGAALHQLDGLMYGVIAASGIQPYSPFMEFDAADQSVGKRVRCGYVTRKQQFLTNIGVNASAFERTYPAEFPRVLSSDERYRAGSSTGLKAPPPPPVRDAGAGGAGMGEEGSAEEQDGRAQGQDGRGDSQPHLRRTLDDGLEERGRAAVSLVQRLGAARSAMSAVGESGRGHRRGKHTRVHRVG